MDEGPAWSTELCGGTHVAATGDIGIVRLVGEGAVAAGVRRIEALTGEAARRQLEPCGLKDLRPDMAVEADEVEFAMAADGRDGLRGVTFAAHGDHAGRLRAADLRIQPVG